MSKTKDYKLFVPLYILAFFLGAMVGAVVMFQCHVKHQHEILHETLYKTK